MQIFDEYLSMFKPKLSSTSTIPEKLLFFICQFPIIFHSLNGSCGLVRGYFSHQLILSYLKVKSESSNDVKKLARTRTRTTNNTIDCVQISQVSLAYSLHPSASLICFMLRGMLAGELDSRAVCTTS